MSEGYKIELRDRARHFVKIKKYLSLKERRDIYERMVFFGEEINIPESSYEMDACDVSKLEREIKESV